MFWCAWTGSVGFTSQCVTFNSISCVSFGCQILPQDKAHPYTCHLHSWNLTSSDLFWKKLRTQANHRACILSQKRLKNLSITIKSKRNLIAFGEKNMGLVNPYSCLKMKTSSLSLTTYIRVLKSFKYGLPSFLQN